MTRSSGKDVLSIHASGEVAGFGRAEVAPAVDPARVAHGLIAIRSLAEMEERVLETIRDAMGACWLALYRPVDGRYRRRRTLQVEAKALPDSLDTEVSLFQLDESFQIDGPECTQLDDRFPGPFTCIRIRTEFEHLPALLIVGVAEVEAGEDSTARLAEVIEVCSIALRNAELVERLQSEVFIDFLTNCYNRRAFEEHLTVEMVRARRYDRALCLLLLDLDNFKTVNDIQGHPQGDHVLQKVSDTLRAAFRTTDRVCRFGGDEFAVIFPETTKANVVRLAERVRRQIMRAFPDKVVSTQVTASMGIACYPGDATRSEELVCAADRALYRAKGGGRNRVVGL